MMPMRWARFPRCGLVACLVLTGGSAYVGAATIGELGAVRIVTPSSTPDYRPVFTPARVRRELRRFLGAACDPPAIVESLARRYRFLGYVPTITAACDDGTLAVTIRESSHRIDLIAFEPEELSRIGMARSTAPEDGPRRLYPVPADAPRGVLRGLLLTREGDVYNFERYRAENEALQRLGYTIAFVAGPPVPATEYPAGAYLVQSLVPRYADAGRGRRRKNYLGGNAAYGPRSGVASGLTYQRSDLIGQLDRLTLAPDYNAGLGGELSYFAPLLAKHRDPRRLYDLNVALFSRFTHNRLLEGEETDERRSGVSLTLGMRSLELSAPHDLKWQFGVRHERVDLEGPVAAGDEDRFTLVRLGLVHTYRHTFRPPNFTLRLVPAVDVAVDTAGGRASFVRPELDATLHSRFITGLELDHHLVGGTVDRDVPEFELWSLGGTLTVRGFREDAFLGRHLVALQSELWIPFVRPFEGRRVEPGDSSGAPAEVPIEPRVVRLLKWALFVDGGYLSGSTSGRTEALLGAGVGLRFVVPHHPLVVRIDYGWGLGGRGGESLPYISLGYRF